MKRLKNFLENVFLWRWLEKFLWRPFFWRSPKKFSWRSFFFFWRALALVSLVLGLGLEHSCPWPRECLSSERLSLALASDFFCVLGLGLEPCVLDSTSGFYVSHPLYSTQHCIEPLQGNCIDTPATLYFNAALETLSVGTVALVWVYWFQCTTTV